DGLQTTLDVAGLIPGVGEIADLANAGISLARGDYAGAALSLVSAIPFAGWFGTAGKAARRGAKAAGDASAKGTRQGTKKASNEASERSSEVAKDGAKALGNAKASKRAQLKRNHQNGKLREKEVEAELKQQGHEILGTQVSVKTPKSRRVIDILIKDGKTGEIRAIEVKAGGAKRSPAQIAKDNALAKQGGEFIGKNAPKGDAYKGTMKVTTEVVN
ncbi:hypothetical protein ACV4V9_20475, partial [Pseudomonas aeruginosa]